MTPRRPCLRVPLTRKKRVRKGRVGCRARERACFGCWDFLFVERFAPDVFRLQVFGRHHHREQAPSRPSDGVFALGFVLNRRRRVAERPGGRRLGRSRAPRGAVHVVGNVERKKTRSLMRARRRWASRANELFCLLAKIMALLPNFRPLLPKLFFAFCRRGRRATKGLGHAREVSAGRHAWHSPTETKGGASAFSSSKA